MEKPTRRAIPSIFIRHVLPIQAFISLGRFLKQGYLYIKNFFDPKRA